MKASIIDISGDELKLVRHILHSHVPGMEVWAFGSRVKGSARRYSDLDLAFISETPLSLELRGCLTEAFSESDLPFRVDILDWATTRESFRHIVEGHKVVLQTATPRIAKVDDPGKTAAP